MPDPSDGNESRIPTKFTLGNVLIYVGPFACFAWFGWGWKVASIFLVAIGIWRSPGFLRRAFGVALMLSILIWGAHAKEDEKDWPGPPLLVTWWFGSFLVRLYADGEKAEADAQRPVRGWE